MMEKIIITIAAVILAMGGMAVGSAVNSNSIVEDGIEYYMQADKAVYNLGEEVQMLYRVTNLGNEDVTFSFPHSPEWNFWVEKDGEHIWRAVNGWYMVMTVFTLSSGESKEFPTYSPPCIWNMQDNNDNLVNVGEYDVIGGLYAGTVEYDSTRVSVHIEIVPESAMIYYVDDDATGANDGSSWTDAYNYLQDALADANSLTKPVEIRVAKGVYTPDRGAGITPGDRYVAFQLINGVTIKGGYAGFGEPDPNARDFELHETILSGDLARNDVEVNDPRYMRGDPTRFENSYLVVTGSGTDTTAILDGFTITGGNSYGHWLANYGSGGGMFNNNGNPMVVDCTFNKNAGNGMLNYKSSPTIIRCRFSLNLDRGMSFTESNPIVTDCIFSRNSSGGMYIISNSSATLTNCTFTANSAYFGGGITCSGNTTMTNCVFIANYAQMGGGGMGGRGTLTNCTFIANWASGPGGGISGSTVLTNCILWGNTAPMGPQIALPYGATVTVSYSNVQGGQAEILNEGTALVWGDGNIDADPFFVRSPHPGPDGEWDGVDDDFGDLRLACSSPCLNTGNNITDPPLPATDFDGNPRIIDGIVDMGAYEGGNQAFVVDGNPVLIREGTTAIFTVALACDPITPINVTVGNFSGDTDIAVESGAALTFDSTNFWIPQTVVLAAAEDADRVEDVAKIRISASGVSFAEVIAWEIENDVNPVLFVDVDASGANDGSSWLDAFKLLQDAMTVAAAAPRAVSEIWVAQGIYKPDQGGGKTPGNRTATFRLINGVTIKGGYAGLGKPDPNVRDVDAYQTILSGDLMGNDCEVANHWDLFNDPCRDDNSLHIVVGSGTDTTAVLDGFTITGGHAFLPSTFGPPRPIPPIPPFPYLSGGGVFIHIGSPTFKNCIISGNSAGTDGGGMYSGGMYNVMSSPTLINCTFSCNLAGDDGGGMYSAIGIPTLINCTFSRNSAGGGGGMYTNKSSPMLINCTFIGNSAGSGGGMANSVSSPSLSNCAFIGNSVPGFFPGIYTVGGAMYNTSVSMLTLTNCTFVGNLADHGRAVGCDSRFHQGPSHVRAINCILWDGGDEIRSDDGSAIIVTYSNVQGSRRGQGNIDADPFFVELGYWDANGVWIEGDYHLLADSPCIDAGDLNYPYDPNETDLDGKPRIIGGRIDMGAYEYSPPIPAEVRIVPRSINLASKGKWITSLFWLPEDYNVADINPNTVFLQREIQAQSLSLDEGQQVATAKFNRSDVQEILDAGEVELTITGRLTNGFAFEGTDVIRVIDKGRGK